MPGRAQMNLRHQIPAWGLLCFSGAGCFQEFNPDAAKSAYVGEALDAGRSTGAAGARTTTTTGSTRGTTTTSTTSSGAGGAGPEPPGEDLVTLIITPPID